MNSDGPTTRQIVSNVIKNHDTFIDQEIQCEIELFSLLVKKIYIGKEIKKLQINLFDLFLFN